MLPGRGPGPIAVVAPTQTDVRDVAIAALRRAAGPEIEYVESRHFRLRWPSGAIAMGFSAEDPDSLRGYEFDTAWCDELAVWRYPDAYDQLQFGVRVGQSRQIVTTTPRPTALIRMLLADPATALTRGRTRDNEVNLAPAAFAHLFTRYAGTRLGRQELDAEVLDDVPGALWTRAELDAHRVRTAPELRRIVVAIDPAVSSAPDADETGLVAVGVGSDGHGYVLADMSGRLSPDAWARRAIATYRTWAADRIVAEVNQGGELVEATLRTVDPMVPYRAVRASRGRRTRAEPVAALYEQGRVHHVGWFPELEDQLCAALPDGGVGPDDRLDALVWGLTALDLAGSGWDHPGAIPYALGVWRCVCGRAFIWASARPCPSCGRPAPDTYDEPVGAPGDVDPAPSP